MRTVSRTIRHAGTGEVRETYQAGIVVAAPHIHRPPLPEPTLADMADRLGGALMQWAAGGFKIAPREVRLERLATCRACEHWSEHARLGLGKCKHPGCGCTRLKLHLAPEKCPIGRWQSYQPTA